jgi:membrane-bound lytic murein transglycosylase D
MIRVFLGLILVWQFSWGLLTIEDDYTKEIQVLKSLDIDVTFLKDPVFVSMKNNLGIYKTKHFLRVLEDGRTFIPVIRQMITKSKIPKAFLYLAMAESNFSAKARSRSRAVGLWQFMPRTAKLLGLKVDRYVDERRDPIKSTKVAIKYLKFLHKRFGKWYLAAIAYNCGEGKLSRVIKKLGSDKLSLLLDGRKKYLPKESRMYIRKIVMMANLSNDEDFIAENNADHLMNRGSTFTLATVEVKGGVSLRSIGESIHLSAKTIKEYNPQLRYYFTPPYNKKYTIYIPYNKYSLFQQNYKPSKSNRKFYVYIIKRGDSLYKIGKKFGISYKIIKDFNHLKSNFLRLGQKLIIPSTGPRFVKYTIKRGDTLSLISKRFKVKIKKIMQANNMKNSLLKPGVKIVIPN